MRYVDAPTKFRSQFLTLPRRVPYQLAGANPNRKAAYFYVAWESATFCEFWISTEYPSLVVLAGGPDLPAVGSHLVVGNGYLLTLSGLPNQQRQVHTIKHTQPLWAYMNAEPGGTVTTGLNIGFSFVEETYV